MQDYAKHAAPLMELTRNDVLYEWNEQHQEAFNFLKEEVEYLQPSLMVLKLCTPSRNGRHLRPMLNARWYILYTLECHQDYIQVLPLSTQGQEKERREWVETPAP